MTLIGFTTEAQTTHTVTNTNDAGAGSLRATAATASSGDIIQFDPGLLVEATPC